MEYPVLTIKLNKEENNNNNTYIRTTGAQALYDPHFFCLGQSSLLALDH